ncbi:MAG: HPP family protein, partial [Pseudomonadota bacterium]
MRLENYIGKMKGHTKSPPAVGAGEIIWSWLGSFLGIAAVAYMDCRFFFGTDFVLLIGSFGASAVLVYGAVKSPLAQPRNFLGGHVISALIGVASYKLLNPNIWLASALAVS